MNNDYLSYTKKWQSIITSKNVQEISDHLNSGFSFHITRQEYEKMKMNNPDKVHYYFAIKNGDFSILVIDNIADQQKNHTNVFEKQLSNKIESTLIQKMNDMTNNGNKITLSEALSRSFRWKMFSQNWLEKMSETYKNFPLIINPFEDLDAIFEDKDETHAYHFFGLKDNRKDNRKDNDNYAIDAMSNYMIDIIVTNISTKDNTEDMNDNSCPGGCRVTHPEMENYSLWHI